MAEPTIQIDRIAGRQWLGVVPFGMQDDAAFRPGTVAAYPSSLVCNGNTSIAGIGREAAGKIWYSALTTYMTSGTDYAGARAATLNAAADLYGSGSAQYNAVNAAWDAVSVPTVL